MEEISVFDQQNERLMSSNSTLKPLYKVFDTLIRKPQMLCTYFLKLEINKSTYRSTYPKLYISPDRRVRLLEELSVVKRSIIT